MPEGLKPPLGGPGHARVWPQGPCSSPGASEPGSDLLVSFLPWPRPTALAKRRSSAKSPSASCPGPLPPRRPPWPPSFQAATGVPCREHVMKGVKAGSPLRPIPGPSRSLGSLSRCCQAPWSRLMESDASQAHFLIKVQSSLFLPWPSYKNSIICMITSDYHPARSLFLILKI